MSYVDSAFEALQAFPKQVILLGIRPDSPEVQYGWIEPGEMIGNTWASRHHLRRVSQFWEKPSASVTRHLRWFTEAHYRIGWLLQRSKYLRHNSTLDDLAHAE